MTFSQIIFLLSFLFNQQSAANLTLNIGEFRNTEGHVLVSIFDNASDFPENAEAAVMNKQVKVTDKNQLVVFENLPSGEYAVVFLHDENGNKEMDTNFVGYPLEGYGASNDAVNTMSAPKFKEAKFTMGAEPKEMKLKIFY